MANRCIKRLLLATTMLVAIFAYSCAIFSTCDPSYGAIKREIFDKCNEDFLGFYNVDGQEYYILVYCLPGG